MKFEQRFRRAFLGKLVATGAGRAHLLSLMVAAEDGDEAGVFDQLKRKADEPRVRKTIDRHQADERHHADLYRACIARNGVEPEPLPDELMIIRRVGRVAGGAFAQSVDGREASRIETRDDVMNTFALLLAIEERGVSQFPVIGSEFRRIGDHETADTFDRVAKDELRHTRYCQALGRRYAPNDEAWKRAVEKYRLIEDRAFKQAGIAGIAYALEKGFVYDNRLARLVGKLLRGLDPYRAKPMKAGAGESHPPRLHAEAR